MRIHLVPNSHIDPVWLWDKYEGIDEVINTFRSACDRLDEYPELTFSASSLQFYEWVLLYDKPLFKRIKKFVDEKRWEVSGGWWVESDSNLILESSLKKHAEISKEFALKHFNTDVTVAFLPDTFGHPATLPKILAETGFKYFIFCRPDVREKQDIPSNLFYWEYEGHKVLSYRLKHHYTLDPDENKLRDEEYSKYETNCFFFGVGDHGGGPTIEEIEFYNNFMNKNPAANIGYSTCEKFFEEAEKTVKNIPVYTGDLHMHAVGCYSVVRDLKNKIRLSEHCLELAGRAMNMTGKKKESLDELWKTTLFNQFHDILPGSCSPAAAEQAKDELGGTISKSLDLTYDCFKKLTGKRRVKAREGEFRIFNTLNYPVTAPLAIESSTYFRGDIPFVDENGSKIEYQKISPSVRTEMSFKWEFIDTLPAQSFKSYFFDSPVVQKCKEKAVNFYTPGKKIENSLYSISSEGDIKSKNAVSLFKSPVSYPVFDDTSDTWGHGVRRYDNMIDSFKPVVSSVAIGPVTSKLYEKYVWGKSDIDAVTSIYNGLPGIYLDIKVRWGERRKILKIEFNPADVSGDSFRMQGAGGQILRKTDGVELPLHHWIWVPQSNTSGLAVIQNGAFSCDCLNGRLRLTLARSSMYGFHDPFKLNDLEPENETDQGIHSFRILLLPSETFDPAELDKKAQIFLEPFHVVREGWKN